MRRRQPQPRFNRVLLRMLMPLGAVAAAGCEDAGDVAVRSESRDSAGVRIVDNPRPADNSRLPWRIGPGPAVSIGVESGEEPYMLYDADAATKLADGRIVIANTGTSELRVFDAAGAHQATWGGAGEGPGEFAALAGIDTWPGDSIVAWDGRTGAISVFDSAGRFGRTFVLETEEGNPLTPRFAFGDGSFLGRAADASGDGYRRSEVSYERRAADGATLLSYGTHPGRESYFGFAGGMPIMLAGLPFSRFLVDGAWGDLVIISPNDDYQVRAYDAADGSLARIVRREHTHRAPTMAEATQLFEENLARTSLPEQAANAFRQAFPNVPLVERFPAFDGILIDGLDHLWVREAKLTGTELPAPLWTVFDPEGRVLGFVETPAGLTILEIGAAYLLGHTTDDLGVESVQVWELER